MAGKFVFITTALILITSGLCTADILTDDIYTIGLWHMDSITSNKTYDDTSVTGRSPANLATAGGNAAITLSTGVYGQALNFGTDGRQIATTGVTWPIDTTTGQGQEFKVDGWFYIPSASYLPIPTAAGGTGAATMYVTQVSKSDGTDSVWYIAISNATNSPSSGLATCYLMAKNQAAGRTARVALYQYDMTTYASTLDRTGMWLHMVALSQYSSAAATTDPDYNRVSVTIDDGTNILDTNYVTGSTVLAGSGRYIWVGHLSSRLSYTPYRGFRGLMDELKISTFANVPTTAHLPSPATGTTGLTYSPTLSWTPGAGALRSEVYFGISSSAVVSAQRLTADINADGSVDIEDIRELALQWLETEPVLPCPDVNYDDIVNYLDFATVAADYNQTGPSLFLGFTTESTFDASEMNSNTTYYWRVDSTDCNQVVTGNVWSFSTATAKAGSPTPANNATGITSDRSNDSLKLTWAKGFAGDSYQVYFGTSSDAMTWLGDTTDNTMITPALQQNTQYYWRVDTLSSSGTITGDLWTFKMGVYAFPGAEGFARWAKGGRGGDVYHVTSLERTGEGTLRYGIDSASGPRTIVFDVTGYIDIHGTFGVNKTNLTIAGQTSPGGIGISGDVVNITGCSDVVIRHMRFRHGTRDWGGDCIDMTSSAKNVILDHLSMQYSNDENWSIDNPQNVTLQWSINAWGLQDHSCGGLVYSDDLTVHHTLWAHNHTRNPKHRNGLMDWVNNVVFDWDIPFICADADSDTHWSNVVNSYFISAGGSTNVFTSAGSDSKTGLPTYHMYLYNTLTDLDNDGTVDGIDRGTTLNSNIDYQTSRYDAPQVTTDDPLLAYKRILSNCGATQPIRDDVDAILMNDLATQYRRIISSESETGASNSGMGTFGTAALAADTDQDGMPDYWETSMGLSTATADNNGDADGDGYTNLEQYLNWLAVPHTQVTAGAYVDVNLQTYNSGFASTATYTINSAVSGTAVILADGHTARFTSTGGTGLASFSYTVNDGSVFTDSVQILVTPSSELTPDPMTWATVPTANSVQSITMKATTASALMGVEYYFACTAGGGHDSGWQDSATYTDTGLLPSTTYSYTAKARDKSDTTNETAVSTEMSATTYSAPTLPSPTAYWMFDETSGDSAADSSGNSNIGTLTGLTDPDTAWITGKFNNCLTLSGAGVLTVPSSDTIDFGDEDMAVSLWLKAPTSITASTQQEILIKGTITTPGTGMRYEFYRKNDGSSDYFRFAIDDNVTKSEIAILSSVVCTGDWVHIVATRDTVNNLIKLYANGTLVVSGTDSTGSISQTEPLTISDATNLLTASVDDVRIYDSALTNDQIYVIYLGY